MKTIKKLLTGLAVLLFCICCAGCIDMPVSMLDQQKYTPLAEMPEPTTPHELTTPPELDKLVEFLAEDKTDEIIYNLDNHRGIDYYVCSGFTRTLASNAKDYGINLGGVSLRDTPTVGAVTKYYHAMNYAIVDDKFVIIDPQDDEIYWLDYVSSPGDTILNYYSIHHYNHGVYRYITIFPNAQMMTNYGKHKETINIDLRGEINETQLILLFPPQ